MTELTFVLDDVRGALLLEGPDGAPAGVVARLTSLLGRPQEVGCARPLEILPPPDATAAERDTQPRVRLTGYYHDSLVEGPGRRSCALLAGCDLGCPGCWTPHLHPADAGSPVPVGRLAEALLDPARSRDGVSLLGGEPVRRVISQ